MSFANSQVLPVLGASFRPLIGRDPYNKRNVDDALKATEAAVKVLEDHLLVNTYLVSERFTLADLFTAGIVSRGFQFFWDPEWRSQHPNITRWFRTVIAQDIYSSVVENTVFTEKALENKPPAGSENKKEKKEKKPAAPAAPKAAPKPKVKTAAEQEEEEDAAPQAPKPKHPLELLGKPTFVLDDWYV
jgi:elongation factor 1-gamma